MTVRGAYPKNQTTGQFLWQENVDFSESVFLGNARAGGGGGGGA